MAIVSFRHDGELSPNLSSFISLWTLSLAPLIAHIFVGVPQRVYLTQERPGLLERLCHWNPTSILWRYFAITDRRARAKSWDKATLAASNALFWNEHGWDGTEQMLNDSRLYMTRIPKKTHFELLGVSFPQTIVVTLQGIQALYQLCLVGSFATSGIAILPTIFLPAALYGLFRLPAAYWLTEEYAFADARDDDRLRRPRMTSASRLLSSSSFNSFAGDRRFSAASELQPIVTESQDLPHDAQAVPAYGDNSFEGPAKPTTRWTVLPQSQTILASINNSNTSFHPVRSWRGILVRILFMLPTCGTVAIIIVYLSIYGPGSSNLSVTGLSMIISYAFFTIVTMAFFIWNFVRRQGEASRTTVIPGIGSFWYKLYTTILFIMALEMFICASLEQIQPPCDGSGTCQGITSLGDFSLTFNATSNQDLWRMGGYINASYVFVSGKYTGFMEGVDGVGKSYNSSLGPGTTVPGNTPL